MSKNLQFLAMPVIIVFLLGMAIIFTTGNSFGASKATSVAGSFYVNNDLYCTETFVYSGTTYYKIKDVAYGLKDVPNKIKVTASGDSLAIAKGEAQPFDKNIFRAAKGKTYTPSKVSQATYNGNNIDGTVYKINGDFCMSASAIGKFLNIASEKSSTGRQLFDTSKQNAAGGGTTEKVTGTVYNKDWPEGTYIIRYAKAPNKVLTVTGGSQDNSAAITIQEYSGAYSQQFIVKKNGTYYNMVAAHSNLNVRLGPYPGDKLVQMKQSPTDFKLESSEKGTRIKIAGYVTYMGVSAGSTNNGTPLIAWTKASEGSQLFIFEKID